MPKLRSDAQFPTTYKFDSANDAQTSITQSVVQDVFWLAVDVEAIRSTEMKFRFFQIVDGSTDKANGPGEVAHRQFYVVTTMDDDFVSYTPPLRLPLKEENLLTLL